MKKLGVIYTVFNGLELLEGSIRQIIDHVDQIVIVYQETSNRGNRDPQAPRRVMELLEKMKEKKIVAIPYHPNSGLNTKQNEMAKHNLGLQILKNFKCTHFLLSAVDHYYPTEDFILAKAKAEQIDVDVTLSGMYTYYKYPTWQITPVEDYYMPFICRLYNSTEYVKTTWSYKVDPAVRVTPAKSFYLFTPDELMMHHYSMVRKDIISKFTNAAASSRWGDKADIYRKEYITYDPLINPGLHYFGGRKVKEVPNYFNI